MNGGLKIDDVLLDVVIKGTHEGLQMADLEPAAVGASQYNTANKDLTVIVGLHGHANNGHMTMNLSNGTARFLASKLMGEELTELDEDAIDAVCEIGNMVAGRFKELLGGTKHEFSAISLPALIFGANYSLFHVKNITSLSVTFEVEEISLVNMKDKFFAVSIALLGQSGI